MDVQPRVRVQILARSALGWSYAEIADDVGVSEYRVGKVINTLADEAEASGPEDVFWRQVIAGAGDFIATDGPGGFQP